MLRPAASIALLLLLALPVLSTIGSFVAARYEIHQKVAQELQSGISAKEKVRLKIPKEVEQAKDGSFRRIHSREFRYEGKMYDVISFEDKGDETWYWAWYDHEETLLLARFENINRQLFGAGSPDGNQILSLRIFFPVFTPTQVLKLHERPVDFLALGKIPFEDFGFDDAELSRYPKPPSMFMRLS